jgi:hypothetical protein
MGWHGNHYKEKKWCSYCGRWRSKRDIRCPKCNHMLRVGSYTSRKYQGCIVPRVDDPATWGATA